MLSGDKPENVLQTLALAVQVMVVLRTAELSRLKSEVNHHMSQ
jgi:hypothetical protein